MFKILLECRDHNLISLFKPLILRANHDGWLACSKKPAELNCITKGFPYTRRCMFTNASRLHNSPMREARPLPHFINRKTEAKLSQALLKRRAGFKPKQPGSGACTLHHFLRLILPQGHKEQDSGDSSQWLESSCVYVTPVSCTLPPQKDNKHLLNRKITEHRREEDLSTLLNRMQNSDRAYNSVTHIFPFKQIQFYH